jgi:hypothetical protein
MPMVPVGHDLFNALREPHYTIDPELSVYHPEVGFVELSDRLAGYTFAIP